MTALVTSLHLIVTHIAHIFFFLGATPTPGGGGAGTAAQGIADKFTGLATAATVILVPLGSLGILGGAFMLSTPAGGSVHKHGWSVIGTSCVGLLIGAMAATIALVFGS